MNKKLFVGNLPYNTSEDSLKEMFSSAGAVDSAKIITDKMSGRSKGFGFVEMATEDDAKKAVETLAGKEIEGRAIIVNEARPMKESAPRRNNFGRSRDGNRGSGGGFQRDSRDRRNSW